MDDMQAEYDLEANRGSMSGLRTMFDFAGIPTDEASVEVATSGIPIYSLLEALSDGRLSELLGEVGQSEPIDFEAVLTEYGASPEMAGLGALAAGMAKGRGTGSIFDGLRGAMDPKATEGALDRALRDADEAFKNRSYSDMDIERKNKINQDVDIEVRQALMDQISKLRREIATENLTPATRASHEAKIKRLRAQIGNEPEMYASGGRPGLYANIHAKRKRIAAGSGERMRRKGEEGAPTAENFRQAAKTEKKNMGGRPGTRRRKRMMVPASYKNGGQVFQKGYYGKSYK